MAKTAKTTIDKIIKDNPSGYSIEHRSYLQEPVNGEFTGTLTDIQEVEPKPSKDGNNYWSFTCTVAGKVENKAVATIVNLSRSTYERLPDIGQPIKGILSSKENEYTDKNGNTKTAINAGLVVL